MTTMCKTQAYDVYLCRHKGWLAGIVRMATRSDWDHICLKKTGEGIFVDFNYPKGQSILIQGEVPWELETFVATYAGSEIDHSFSEKYSILFNLNWLFRKWFRWAPFRGYNCVKFVCIKLGLPPAWAYLSPAELAQELAPYNVRWRIK